MGFNENLRFLLKEQALRQADLCRMTGIQTSLMSDYIGGKKSPTIGNAILIADALGISLDALVEKGSGQPAEFQKRATVYDEVCEAARELTEDEQRFLLDTIKALKKNLR